MKVQAKKYTFTVGASASYRLLVTGRFMRTIAALGLFDVESDQVKLEDLVAGDGFEQTEFTWLTFRDKSGAPNTITVVVADSAFLNAPQTSTAITANKNPQTAGMVHTAPAVGVASAQLIAANTARQYLLVQNQSASNTIWLRFGAAAAVAGVPCIKVSPGGYWEWDGIGVTQAVQAISDLAAASVAVVEG